MLIEGAENLEALEAAEEETTEAKAESVEVSVDDLEVTVVAAEDQQTIRGVDRDS